MLDLRFVKEHKEEVIQNVKDRFMDVDVERAIALYDERNRLIAETEELRKQRNDNAKSMKQKLEPDVRATLIAEGKNLKEKIAVMEKELDAAERHLNLEARKIPNMAHPDAPVGKEEKDNTVMKQLGDIPKLDFKAKDHLELGESLDILDFETATKVSGTKFYYLKNEGVFLELALTRYALDILAEKGFTVTITPDIAREEVVEGIGFNPRGEESNIYVVEDTGTCLVGTAEITLGGYYANKILEADELPVRIAGFSHCFRREAGAAGQYSKGLYRVHQFSKVEMFIFCTPETSEQMHNELLTIEEEIFSGLGIPFRVVDTCTGDLGAPAYRKYDLEAWMPGRGNEGGFGEITSTSNCTDYQARRLKIRYRREGKPEYVHMLNGTAIAVSRGLIALLENFQQADGSVKIPDALVPYTGFETIPAR